MNRGPRLIERIIKNKALFPIALIISINAWALSPYSWGVALMYCLMPLLLWGFERHFSLFRNKSQLHLTLFALMSILVPSLHTDITGSIVMVLTVFSIFLLFESYQQRDAVLSLHFIGILLGIGTLIDPRTSLFVLVVWLVAYQVQAIRLKGFVSSLLGMILPIILWLSYLFVNKKLPQFPILLSQYKDQYIPQIPLFSWTQWTILGLIIILVITATAYLLKHAHYDKLRTATYMNLIAGTSFFLFVCILFFENWWTLLMPSLYALTSILVGHYFSNQKGKLSGLALMVILLLMVTLGAYEVMVLK